MNIQQQQKCDFYGIMPASVRHDNRLSAGAKVLYAEITTLVKAAGYCWATNQYFAELLNTSTRSITRYVTELQKGRHIKVDITHKDYRAIRKISVPAMKKFQKREDAVIDPRQNCDPTEEEARRALGW